ncbi:MAG: hypothetical protein ACOC44_05575 [Promethearchaeia archaeon]
MNRVILAKVSGKIIEDKEQSKDLIDQCKKIVYNHQYLDTIILIPGGGNTANLIRYIDHKLDVGDELVHWMAILAMDFNADQIHRKFSSVILIENLQELKKTIEEKKRGIYLFKPFSFLYNEDFLPHSWDITSDSIALSISHRLNLSTCFLIKNVEGIFLGKPRKIIKKISADKLKKLKENGKLADLKYKKTPFKKSQPVDNYLPLYVKKFGIDCIILKIKQNFLIRFFNSSIDRNNLGFTRILSS